MGEILWMKFMDECVKNLQEVLLTVGVNGLLAEYDQWLETEGYIKCEHGVYCKHAPNVSDDCWQRCDWAEAQQYRSRVLTGSIGLEGPWSDWIEGKPEKTQMNREYAYRKAAVSH